MSWDFREAARASFHEIGDFCLEKVHRGYLRKELSPEGIAAFVDQRLQLGVSGL